MTDSALRLLLREKHRLRRQHVLYEVRPDGSEGGVIATIRLGMLHGESGTVFYADPELTRPMFGFAGRVLAERFEIVDDRGAVLGSFSKDWKASVLRSTWQLSTVDGLTAAGRERSRPAAVLRRVVDDVPFLVVHFDFVTDDGHVVLSSVRRRTLRHEYELTVPVLPDGRRLDWRVAAAMGVALETVQLR